MVKTKSVLLSCSITIAGAAHVMVNGNEASFNSVSATWSYTVGLEPGFNRILLQVLDSGGVQLMATNQDIVAELASLSVGGVLSGNTTWSNSMGILHVTNTVIVPSGGRLSIESGCVLHDHRVGDRSEEHTSELQSL